MSLLLSISKLRAIPLAAALAWLPAETLATDTKEPAHPATQLFINNHRYGPTNGCGTSPLGATGRSVCGHPGHVSEVTWTFLRRTSEGDVYKLTRKYPSDSTNPTLEAKEITYVGS